MKCELKEILLRSNGILLQAVGSSFSVTLERLVVWECLVHFIPNTTWFKEKAVLAEAQEAGQILDEKQLAFLADPGIPNGQAVQITIPNNASFQTEDLDAYDSDCDDVSNEKVVLMANLSSYGSDILLE
nr:hypothetical protein [Tanacetum cinerariifolium]